MGNAEGECDRINADGERESVKGRGNSGSASAWSDSIWLPCRDGKLRRVPCAESGIRPLAARIPGRVGQLRAYGNSIAPPLAAEFIKAVMECNDIPRRMVPPDGGNYD